MHERLDQPDLLFVPVGQRGDADAEIEVEPIGQVADGPFLHAAPQRADVRELLEPGEPVVEPELARQVADAPVDLDRVATSVQTEDGCPPVGRMKSRTVRIVVVLPAPLGPRYPKISPRSTENVRSTTPRERP
jgi:hypothetical protein